MALLSELSIFSVHFTDSGGTDADPTTVALTVREEIDGTSLFWTFNAVPVAGTHYPVGMNPIVKDSTGDYHVDFLNRKPERLTGVWVGAGTIFRTHVQTFLVRHSLLPSQEV